MALNFPSSPTSGQTYSNGDYTYVYDGVKWTSVKRQVTNVFDDITSMASNTSLENGDWVKIINPVSEYVIGVAGDMLISNSLYATLVIDTQLTSVARIHNVRANQVVYSDDKLTVLDTIKYVYDADSQFTWVVPTLSTSGETITNLIGNLLTTSDSTYALYLANGTEEGLIENRLKSNQSFNIPGADGSLANVLQTFPVGQEFSAGRFVVDTDLVNVNLLNGVVSADSGSYYVEYEGDFTGDYYGIKLADNTQVQTGCTISLEGGNTRITVDMTVAPSHKFVGLSERRGNWPDINDLDSRAPMLATDTTISSGQSWDGVDYVDPDAIGANPVAKIYPDGSIVGSTDNGKYTKYPNGEMICSVVGSSVVTSIAINNGFHSTSVSMPFPVEFTASGSPTIVYGITNSTGVAFAAGFSPTTLSASAIITSFESTDGGAPTALATGKWK